MAKSRDFVVVMTGVLFLHELIPYCSCVDGLFILTINTNNLFTCTTVCIFKVDCRGNQLYLSKLHSLPMDIYLDKTQDLCFMM